jgi:hypothetical protein
MKSVELPNKVITEYIIKNIKNIENEDECKKLCYEDD